MIFVEGKLCLSKTNNEGEVMEQKLEYPGMLPKEGNLSGGGEWMGHRSGGGATITYQGVSSGIGVTPAVSVTPGDLLRLAMEKGDLDRLERLMELEAKYEANAARKAFADDMARFKARAGTIDIVKDKQVGYTTKDGDFVGYMHATIGNVVQSIVPALAEFGFSHRWDIEQKDGAVYVTCVITHRMGHSQSTTLFAAPDASGKKNGIQSIISTKTYLERHTLLAATGLATKDQEDDDSAAGGAVETLADKWIARVNVALTDGAVVNLWEHGSAELEKAKDRAGYEAFKKAVSNRRGELQGAAQ